MHPIQEHLECMARLHPKSVLTNLKEGSIVPKSATLNYIVDDLEIYKSLGNYDPGKIPVGQIYAFLEPSQGKIAQLFGDRKTISFSEVVKAGLGECLEKGILAQMCAQSGEDASFLINGYLEVEEGPITPAYWHGFNVVFREGKPHLVDTQGPLRVVDGKVTHPYIAPIVGMEAGRFEVPEEWQQGRTYSIW